MSEAIQLLGILILIGTCLIGVMIDYRRLQEQREESRSVCSDRHHREPEASASSLPSFPSVQTKHNLEITPWQLNQILK